MATIIKTIQSKTLPHPPFFFLAFPFFGEMGCDLADVVSGFGFGELAGVGSLAAVGPVFGFCADGEVT